ncbi:MAG: hypothetical protein Kow0031_36850 [Anaerolineae bacterium]
MPHPRQSSRKPEGQLTRGKTARNRLRRADNFLLMYDAPLLRRSDGPFREALFVDLGYGAEPVTTLESARRFRWANPTLPVLGVEIEPERVAIAQPFADDLTRFRLGGFNLPLHSRPDGSPETVRLVRAFNVLRQYDEPAVTGAYARLFQQILPGGLLLEGTSTPFGRVWVANVARALPGGGWQAEALVFSTSFRSGFNPAEFQTVLPKNLIHRVTPGEPIFDFFEAWKRSAAETRPLGAFGLRQWFGAAAERLAAWGYNINLQRKWLRRGYLVWRLPGTAPQKTPLG